MCRTNCRSPAIFPEVRADVDVETSDIAESMQKAGSRKIVAERGHARTIDLAHVISQFRAAK
jgi:hypothetical protein